VTEVIEELADRIRSAGSVVALTGAGISTPSGIPDFRTPGTGLWENVNPMEVAHVDVLLNDPAMFWAFYAERFTTLQAVKPNPAHMALVELEQRGLLDAVITQNVDRLHFAAGTQELVELHGTIQTSRCMTCGTTVELDEVRELASGSGDGVPRCICGGMIRPGVVLFGEMLPQDALFKASQLAAEADVILCIGSSLEVHPAAGLPQVTKARGGAIAIMTQGPTPLDADADFRLGGDVVVELEQLVAALA